MEKVEQICRETEFPRYDSVGDLECYYNRILNNIKKVDTYGYSIERSFAWNISFKKEFQSGLIRCLIENNQRNFVDKKAKAIWFKISLLGFKDYKYNKRVKSFYNAVLIMDEMYCRAVEGTLDKMPNVGNKEIEI